ncbi:mutS protein homolog 4 [Aspergillus lentulus]|uniref:MutS protein homolog 4 n=1 Tax=Aspergillus lentulus TaxID=293939 RepID=A0ABQ1A6U0_ASPLE|nr:mutS protein homolog 4 [Aspergillus lentulus]GFF72125.1 mutS protein homolog 4 [Aspergillus lentulus]GFF74973.1 mutS protein homolog 4 [Aspergillus lentulus]GFG04808.1 mutS protein homolog 4 [Aspergillus lentulus]
MSRPLSRVSSSGEASSFAALTSRQDSDRPRTARPATTATSIASQDIICAISESRGVSSTVGLAFVNLSTAETVLCQICDSQTYAKTVTKIAVFEPTEILFMSSAKESKLFYIIRENIPETTYTFLDRRYWSEKVGHEYLDRLAFPQDVETIKTTLGGNYFASCCLAAVLKYIELELDRVFTSHSLRIRFEPSQGSMSIDLSTIASLELIQNLQNAKSKDSLFGLLNETLTPMGARLLRANILQPCTENSKLLARYDAVEDLSTKENMFISVRQALKGFIDADKVLTSLILAPTKRTFQYVEQSVNNVIMLKTYVSSIKSIYKALATAQSRLLMTIRELCAPAGHRVIEQLIEKTLNEHVTYQTKPLDLRNQRIYCVRAGVNSLLDVARQTYKEANVDAAELVAKLSESHNLNLDIKFDSARQYYISVSASEVERLPEIFINIYRRKNRIECQTLDLVKLNQKIIDAHNEVINMSDQTIQSLINDVCSEISVLFKVSEAIGMLDLLAAFAELATCNEYIRPELTDVIAIKSGRHPIREKIHTKKFIPNDAYATQQSRFQIITGSNMSGKSTYIRSLALMTIMAQIGCFVPAEYASFPVIHQLFARVSTSDDLEANVSTFAAEMREMAFILRNIEPRSMVIVDELGRGTSTTDGLAIAIAIAEALIESRALVWFVTHFRDLALILAERSGVVSLHLAAEISPDISRMVMLYKIAEGPDMTQFYGLAVAKLVDLPPGVLECAQAVSEKLNKIAQRRHSKSKALMLSHKRNLLLSLREQLLQARNGTLEGDALWEWLKKLQDNFVLRMAAIEDEAAEMSDDEVDNDPDTVPAEAAQDSFGNTPSQERAEGASGDEPQTAILISSSSMESGTDPSSREMSHDENIEE